MKRLSIVNLLCVTVVALAALLLQGWTGALAGMQQQIRPSAYSSDLFGHNQMRFAWTSVIGTHASFQFVSTQDAVSLRDVPFAMDPLRLNRVEPRTFRG